MEDSYRKRMGLGQDGNALVNLIVINAVLFVIIQFVYVVYTLSELKGGPFFNNFLGYFSLPASLDKLSARPWTVLSFMFSDSEVFRFIGNMIWLWGFGYIFQDLAGNRKLIPIYIYGGLMGALVFLLTYAFVPHLKTELPTATLLGAGPAVMAIAIATTAVAPDYRIFPMINGGIPLWILTVLYLLIDLTSISRMSNTANLLANLGGAAAGFIFIFLLRKGRDGSIWMNQLFDWCNDLFNPDKKRRARNPKDEFYYKVSGTQPYKKIPNVTQQRIDEILDKINRDGYRFLTDEEKEILKRAADEEDL